MKWSRGELKLTNFWRHPRFWRHVLGWTVFIIITYQIFSNHTHELPEGCTERNGIWVEFISIGVDILSFYGILSVINKYYKHDLLWSMNKIKKSNLQWLKLSLPIILIVSISAFISTVIYHQCEDLAVNLKSHFLETFIGISLVYSLLIISKYLYHAITGAFTYRQLEKENLENELKLVKGRINPHFLFNILNTIYAENLSDGDRGNELILDLSDLLRYQLNANRTERISLETEINVIEKYLELEKSRLKDCQVEFHREGDFTKGEIAPQLLLPIIENAFRHGAGLGPKTLSISLVKKEDSTIEFICDNPIGKTSKMDKKESNLHQLKERLDYNYPDKYTLKAERKAERFIVRLVLFPQEEMALGI